MKISDLKDTTAQMISQYQRNDIVKQDTEKAVGGAILPQEEKVDLSTRARDIQQIKTEIDKLPVTV